MKNIKIDGTTHETLSYLRMCEVLDALDVTPHADDANAFQAGLDLLGLRDRTEIDCVETLECISAGYLQDEAPGLSFITTEQGLLRVGLDDIDSFIARIDAEYEERHVA